MNCFCLSKKSFSSASFTHAPIIRHSVGMLGGDRGRKVPLSPYVKQMNFRTDSKSFISEEFIMLSYRFHQLGMDRPSSRKSPKKRVRCGHLIVMDFCFTLLPTATSFIKFYNPLLTRLCTSS